MNTYLLLGALQDRAYQWIAPDLEAFAALGMTGNPLIPDAITLEEASVWSGIPAHTLQSARECERIKLPGRMLKGLRFSRFALVAWYAVNSPEARMAAWGAERARVNPDDQR